ncbi:MAG: potassium/proton antiporter [Alteromonas sp.]|uniref:Potassium transporter TrkA n=1 Tax=Alteromonas australica TaxID=589873 RepID=A0A075NWU3_9ALTE|nr:MULTISPECIES: potassium/proton antiporter [Alteromonas]AIF97928.1 potassium transporter TrkA [Alteromonas australica]MAB92355.1 potassium/proton antiporter [Alteromonas sp.]MAO30319.1 potassium/proton antiporter [Alteromonas sp.]QPL49359.1 potassium/proton antiporter [Alteromonas sp. B31-7]|tara:strand:+ start:237 stop:1697 length:1461 start_codon:yes stop_codon:yes gene_type:complete
MFAVDHIILLSAVLAILGVLASKLSPRFGVPVLVLFLGVGMLAGEDGIGRIHFDNADTAHSIGTFALILILFDGGLQTSRKSIMRAWKPAALLATLGVIGTATVTGLAAMYILDLPLYMGLLLGAIVGSTDAAAVFSVLRNAGIAIPAKIKATLELESASNDPMAIFLTVGLITLIQDSTTKPLELLTLFASQMGLGALVGGLVGGIAVWLFRRVTLMAIGLYPVFVMLFGVLAFGLAANVDGSGFLATFITGVVIGNSRFSYQRNTFVFLDGLAWLGQIAMFVILGLLVTPSELFQSWKEGLLIAAVLIFVARPLVVMPLLLLNRFSFNAALLISWVGLRGSVPIILAIFPLIFGLPNAELIFNVVFFIVLISALLQGSSLPFAARKLGLVLEGKPKASNTIEIVKVAKSKRELIEIELPYGSPAVGLTISELSLPEGTIIALVARGEETLIPKGSITLQEDDQVFIVTKLLDKNAVEACFYPEK